MKLYVLNLFISCIVLFLVACGNAVTSLPKEVIDFEFTSQDNKRSSLKEFDNKWWIANFMYTNCTFVCPTTMPNLSNVQNNLQELDLDIQIISFSVDPSNDSPKILREYIEEYQVNTNNWSFLTGYSFEDIQKLSEDFFDTVLEGGGPTENEFVHSTNFFLVSPKGEVIEKYNGLSKKEIDIMIDDLKTY